jgi:hypothetical protein
MPTRPKTGLLLFFSSGVSDTTAPTVTITANAATVTAAAFTATFTFSEAVIGFDATKITVTNGAAGAVAGTGPYTSVITPTGTGTVTVQVEANKVTDAALNNNTASNTFSILYVAAKVWLDFSDVSTLFQDAARTSAVTADGQEILGVADKSGTGNHASGAAGTSPLYKVNIQNGKSIALFDGVDNLLSGTLTATNNNNTVFIVYQNIAAGGTGEKFVLLLNAGTGDANRVTLRNSGSNRQNNFGGALSIALSASFVIETFIGNGAGNNFEYVRNGSSQGTSAHVGTPTNATMYYLASERGVGAYANVRIAEFIAFNSTLSSDVRTQIRTYLNTKWAVF